MLPKNHGPSAARNLALKAAKGTWVQYLDCDDFMAPTKFEMQAARCARVSADVAAVYSPWTQCYIDDGRVSPRKGPTVATAAGLMLAHYILDYRNEDGLRFPLELQRTILILKDDGITAKDIQRVCLMVFFASAAPERYHGLTNVENLAMCRAIKRLAPLQRRGMLRLPCSSPAR